METAMEQRNTTATLASYGQDASDFGPETDVDTPDEPVSLTKPKAERESSVIDESGEDSEEDGGGWNYYNKSTEDIVEKKKYPEEDNNSEVDDMDYKLNPDAPEFVPVSSPPANHAQRILNMDNDAFISSSPQKYNESIDNVDVPNENDFANEIKARAADLSEFSAPHEPNDESTMVNDTKSLSENVTIGHDEAIGDTIFQHEHISNEISNDYQNPFVSSDKVDLNKVHDLSQYQNNDAQTFNTNPYVSIVETSKNNELNSTNGDNVLQNEPDAKLNDNFSINGHIKYEQDMNSRNINDIIDTTVDSSSQLDESFKPNDDFKNEFINTSHIDKHSEFGGRKLNDSVSTTDAVLGSEPNTPIRMDNHSTFESENEDDQLPESFKQQMQFNQFDECNNKENHDPFSFEQIEDPIGIIPNVTHEEIDEMHHNDDINIKPNNSSDELELTKHEPVEEPLCVKEEAKPFHSVYEQQYLPESDFSASTHEALLNATENNVNVENFKQYDRESFIVNKEENVERQDVNEHIEQESKAPSHVDEVEQNDRKQENYHDSIYDFEQETNSIINSEHIQNEHIRDSEHKYVEDLKQENCASDYIQNYVDDIERHHEDYGTVNSTEDSKQEHGDIAKVLQNYVGDVQPDYHSNDAKVTPNNTLDMKQEDQYFNSGMNEVKNIAEAIQSHAEEFEQKYKNFSQQMQNDLVKTKTNGVQQEHHGVEVINNPVDDFKQDNINVVIDENIHIEDFKQTLHDGAKIVENLVGDFQQEQHGIETVQYNTAYSDEEMHSSMIIHSDVENNMPQPYCSAHDTLMNEPDMMCTSMTFEENFQNRNMSDSLYVMETSSDYFGDLQQTIQLNQSLNESRAEQPSNVVNDELIEPVQIQNKIITEERTELVSESKSEEVKSEETESSKLISQNVDEKIEKQEESNKVAVIAAAAVVGAVAIAGGAGASLASKKSTSKKLLTTISKAKTTTTKTSPTKPLAFKTSAPTHKKTTLSTTSKPLSRPTTAPSTSKPITNVRSTTIPKTTTLKATTGTKVVSKPASKTIPATLSASAKTMLTTPRTPMIKTTPVLSPKTPTTPKTLLATKSSTTPKPRIPRTPTVDSKQPLSNGSPKLVSSRPTTAPTKKPLSSATANSTIKLTNGITKLTNGGMPKTSTTKTHVTLATRMSLAPPKLPPKIKVAAPKTEISPAMPGPIRRPKVPITKKTETATS